MSKFDIDFTINDSSETINITDATRVDVLNAAANLLVDDQGDGLEGIAFDDNGTTTTADDVFYVAMERPADWLDDDGDDDIEVIYSVPRAGGTATPVDITNLLDANDLLLGQAGADVSDLYFARVGSAATPTLFMSSEDATADFILKAERVGGVWTTATSATDSDFVINVTVSNLEGITFDPTGIRMFAVADGTGTADHFEERRFGDFNSDGDLDSDDIDVMFADFFDNLSSEEYDMNADGDIDQDDVFLWITEAFGSYMGDANLDGQVDAADLNALGQHWQQTGEWLWSDGNFFLDDIIDQLDLNILGLNWLNGTS